jgi:hypothetical protein
MAKQVEFDRAKREGEAPTERRAWEPVALVRLGTFGDALFGGSRSLPADGGSGMGMN